MTLALRSGDLRLEIDERGALVVLTHVGLGIALVGEPRLASSFRLLLPLPHRRGHYLDGREQTLSSSRRTADGLELRWDGLTSEEGRCDLTVRETIRAAGDSLTFTFGVTNRTPYAVEELQGPLLGGLANPAERDDWILQWHHLWKAEQRRFYAEFPSPGLGDEHPILMHPVTSMPWCDLFDRERRRGVYFGVHDPQPRAVVLVEQLFPNNAFPGRWPEPDEVDDGEPIGASLGWAHFPFLPPGASWVSPPVVVRFHEGTWYAAADCYREWFTRHFELEKQDSWLYHEDAWQSTIVGFPDDTIRYRFRDLPQLARDAKAHGIRVIQIDGWDVGGIDRGYPQYEPDPRLGTPAELREAIADCQAEGVRVLLFANVQSVNTETDLYRDRLVQETVRDLYGNPVSPVGWGYHTCLGYLGQAAPKQVQMRTEGPFQQLVVDALVRLADLGADGLQLDKTNLLWQIDYPAGEEAALAYQRGLIAILEAVRRQGAERNPAFRLATEAWLDRLVPVADAAYTRVFEPDHVPALEYTFPEYRLTNCLMGVDFALANSCIRFGHIVNFECDNLHGSTASRRRLAGYVAELLRLRRELADVLWYGRIAEPLGIRVSDPCVGLTAWHGRDGRRALVLMHLREDDVTATVAIDELPDGDHVRVHRPFAEPVETPLPAAITLPRNRLAVLEWRPRSGPGPGPAAETS